MGQVKPLPSGCRASASRPPKHHIVGQGNVGRDNVTNIGNSVNTYNHYNERAGGNEELRALRKLVVPDAMHDSKEVDKEGACHPGTRTIVLEDVSKWIENPSPKFTIQLMTGAAGAGKSAIARTVAKLSAKKRLLLASFFCCRSSEGRSDGARVIPTLVGQTLTRIPSVRPFVEDALRRDPHLLTKSLKIQAMHLIVEPLASIEPSLHQCLPRVIVIDGLDEIRGAEVQCDVLKVIAFLIDNLPIPVRFLVTSRPEHQIQDYLAQSMENKWGYVSLDEGYHPDHDIFIYYKAHFSIIVATLPAYKLEPDWPGEAVRQVLVAKGPGQFIFAAVVIRFVGNTSCSISPQKRLEMILENVANEEHNPLKLLDLGYVTVFRAVPEEELKAALRLVGLMMLPVDFKKSPRVLDAVLCLEPGTTESRLRYLQSFLKVPSFPDEPITPLHSTLGDFVFNHHRSRSFGLHLNQEEFQQDVILRILDGSLAPHESEQLDDCFNDWFVPLYRVPMCNFGKNPAFRDTLAAHINEIRGTGFALLPPLALMGTFRLALEVMMFHCSWLDLKGYLYWWWLEKKRLQEELKKDASIRDRHNSWSDARLLPAVMTGRGS